MKLQRSDKAFARRPAAPNHQDTGGISMANFHSSTTHTAERRLTAHRTALAALDADLAMREMLRALAEAIEILDERSFAFEVCTAAFIKNARLLY
jgi:hypothetical protein